jgi:hypothetical protein
LGQGEPSSSKIALVLSPEVKVLFLNESEILKGKKIVYSILDYPLEAAHDIAESSDNAFKDIKQDAKSLVDRH